MKLASALLFLFLLFTCAVPQAQTAPGSAKPTAANSAAKAGDYSKEGIVVEHLITHVTFDADGKSTRDVSADVKVQADAGVKELAVLSFAYTGSNESVDIDYVRVRKPDGTVVVTPDYNVVDMPADVTRVAPMYSDIHEKHITVKALGVGDTLQYHVIFRNVKPEVPGQFWFDYSFEKDGICKDEQLEVSVPKEKHLDVSSPGTQPQIREQGDRRVYLWKASHLQREVPNDKEIPKREVPRPDVELTSFQNWGEVGQWYAELQKPELEVTPAIQAKANEIVKGLTSEDDKIRAIYNYVSTHFHYVSLSFGIGRYQPHAADDVLGNEYGDCKDKHTLLATMLKAIGVDAWPALINSSRKIADDLPSPASFDHVITVVPRGTQNVWLDSTAEVAPFGMLFANLRDKKALIIPTNGTPSLVTTPAALPFQSDQEFVAKGELADDGTFTGQMKSVTRGDSEVLFRIGFRQVPQAQWKLLAQRVSYALGFGGDVSDVQANSPEDTSKPFQFTYHYVRKQYSDWDNHRITPPMPPMGIEVADTDERKPVEPFLLGAPGDVTYRAEVKLPSFSKAKAPSSVDLVEDFAEYHSRYSIENGVLKAERRFVIKKKEVPLAEWDKYTKFRKAVSDDENHYISLDGDGTATATNIPDNSSPAAKKFQEAVMAMQNRDIALAEQSLRDTIQLDPKYPRAHLALGGIYMMEKKTEDALAEVRKEEEVNPDLPSSYITMASFLSFLNRKEEVLEQWQKLLKVHPDNVQAATNASLILLEQKKYPEVIALLQTALKSSPDNNTLQLQLSSAYISSGQKEKAFEIIRNVAAKNPDANSLNSAAWELGDANLQLDEALKYSEKSLELLDKEATSADDYPSVVRASNYSAYWDTLGWIYYHKGDLAKAESYLNAGWKLTQDPVIGDHLAQVFWKQGKRAKAEHLYKLVFAASRSADSRQEFIGNYKKLTGRAPDLTSSTHRLPNGTWSVTPTEELSRMRTFKILTDAQKAGIATFAVEFSPEKVLDVKYVDGAQDLESVAKNLYKAKIDQPFPSDVTTTHIVRRGVLTCGQTGCDFTLLLPQNANLATTGSPF